tara:strand:+ start:1027 stop:1680 length:654 start_codon:yes stop_codon:yes gene_type:complete
MKIFIIIPIIFLNFIFSQGKIQTNLFGADLLNENPIYPIPAEMTFEEYQDMNRRLGVGLLLAAIPIPGTIHDYAGEEKIAKKIRWVAAGSVVSIIIGAISTKEGNWEESPYETYTLNEGEEDELRYEMIPIGSVGTDIEYDYVELHKTRTGGATFLIPLGISVLLADYLYDYIHGIKTIENKRDKVRFKYGKNLDFAINPIYDINKGMAGINFSCKF